MKKKLLVLAISFLSLKGFSQEHEVTVYAEISPNGGVDYMGLDNFLPDSITTRLFGKYIKSPKKVPGPVPQQKILLKMTLDGWKLVTVVTNAGGFNGNVTSDILYLLRREINLDDSSFSFFVDKINSTGKK